MADDFTRRQFLWLDQVADDPAVTAAGFLLAYRIAKHINRGTGEAWPSQPLLPAEVRLSVRSIRDLSDQLEAEELELGAMRYAAVRTSEDPTYTKHPSTWLNNKCWLDEPEPARGNFGERQSFQRQAPLSHVEIALAGLRGLSDDE